MDNTTDILKRYSQAKVDERLYLYMEYGSLREEFLKIDMNPEDPDLHIRKISCKAWFCNMLFS